MKKLFTIILGVLFAVGLTSCAPSTSLLLDIAKQINTKYKLDTSYEGVEQIYGSGFLFLDEYDTMTVMIFDRVGYCCVELDYEVYGADIRIFDLYVTLADHVNDTLYYIDIYRGRNYYYNYTGTRASLQEYLQKLTYKSVVKLVAELKQINFRNY